MVNDLESDLMPFLQKTGYSNFKIDREFPWIKEAISDLNRMIEENIIQPNELLAKYKEYEYILNVDKKELIDGLFLGEKKSLEEIKEQIAHYDQAYKEIMTCSEDDINFNIFKVVTKKLKNELGDQAAKIRDKILEATYNWCNENTIEIRKTFTVMIQKIDHDPANERELIDTRAFIAASP
jgi:translation initiation factor 2 beta subunit (eIF-2beta)/eIF-5